MHDRPVAELMTRDVMLLTPGTSFRAVARALLARGVDAAPVVESGRLLGVVSTADLTCHEEEPASLGRLLVGGRAEREHARKGRARTARELMTSPAVCVGPRTTVGEALRTMSREGVGRVVVVDGERVVGVLTRSDVLRVFLREDDELRREVEDVVARTVHCPCDVDVDVREGVVRLDGWVELASCGWAAVAGARDVPGVVDVEDHLTYRVDDAMLEQLALRGTFA